jgi:hypothetical protein
MPRSSAGAEFYVYSLPKAKKAFVKSVEGLLWLKLSFALVSRFESKLAAPLLQIGAYGKFGVVKVVPEA